MAKSTRHEEKPKSHVGGFYDAFLKTATMRAALKKDDLSIVNIDARVALTTVLRTVTQLALYRDDMKKLPNTDIHLIDNLNLLAEALAYAHSNYMAATQPAEPIQVLQAEATERRDMLLLDATTLAKHGIIDGAPLEALKQAPGYLNMTTDLGTLTRIFRDNWDKVVGRCVTQLSDIEKAEELFERITYAYGERQQPGAHVAAATEDRQRAFTLLLRAYDEARRAIAYLRWHEGDAETIAPSLWAGRGGRSHNNSATPDTNAPGGTTPTPGNVAPIAPVAPSPPITAPHADAPVNAPTVIGLPGGSPFTRN